MSTPATVTDAHRALASEILDPLEFRPDKFEYDRASQLIADHDAELQKRLKAANMLLDLRKGHLAEAARVHEAQQAELDSLRSQLASLHAVCGFSDADRFTTRLDVEIGKRMEAEAKIAALVKAGDALQLDADVLTIRGRHLRAAWDAAKTGATVKAPEFSPISGQLSHAGTMCVGHDAMVTGVFIKMTMDELKSIPRLPMYKRVTVTAEGEQ